MFLDMSRNPLGSACMGELFEALCRTHLHHLCLSNCDLDALCAKGLAFLLDNSLVLQDVDLSWNRIGPDGTKVICEALQFNQSLVSIDLGHNGLGTAGGAFLGEVLCDNRCGVPWQLSQMPSPCRVGGAVGPGRWHVQYARCCIQQTETFVDLPPTTRSVCACCHPCRHSRASKTASSQ